MNDFLILLVLLVLSGVFSGSETALVSLSMARAESLYREGRRGAYALFQLKTDPSRMLITILIGNNVVNIAASAMATVLATEMFGNSGPGIAVGVLTILILIFGEITPKSLATRYAERISLFIAPVIYGFMKMIYPLVWTFLQFTDWLHERSSVSEDPTVTESEVITMVEHGEKEGVIEADEREMITRIFNLNDLMAEDVMTPRRQVFRLDGRLLVKDVLPEILDQTYSRIPLYEHDPDEITKLVFIRDLMNVVASGNLDIPLNKIAQEPVYTPSNQPIDELILTLRSKHRHMAIVVDEHGVMLGVVTLEDLLEELVGEIYDETDTTEDELEQLDKGRIRVNGTTEVRVVEEHFGMDVSGKPTDTINRWLLDHREQISSKGEEFELEGLIVHIEKASSRRVHQVILAKVPDKEKQAETNAAPEPGSVPKSEDETGQ